MRRKLSGLKLYTEVWEYSNVLVEEQCVEAEALAEAGVDETQERMPA